MMHVQQITTPIRLPSAELHALDLAILEAIEFGRIDEAKRLDARARAIVAEMGGEIEP